MPKALVVLAPGFEEIEAVSIIDILRRGEIDVTVAGLTAGAITGSHDITIVPDTVLDKVDHHVFDILVLPGGQPGTNNLKADDRLLQWIRERFENKQKIAAICAAPTVLHRAGITDHLELTSYPSEKEVFTNSKYLEQPVVKDGQVITSRGVGTALAFGLAIIEELQGREKAQTVAERILFKAEC